MTPAARHKLPILLLAAAALSLSACAGTPGKSVSGQKGSAAEAQAYDHRQPLPVLESAYKRNTGNASAALAYAEGLQDAGRLQRAAMVLSPFLQDTAHPNAPIIAEYASIEAAKGDYNDAELYARQSMQIDPSLGQPYHVMGIALDAQGKHEEAESSFRKALARWQGDPAPVLNNLGLNLAAQGFLDEAVDTLQKAADLDPGRPDIERNLRIVTALRAQAPHPDITVPIPKEKPGRANS